MLGYGACPDNQGTSAEDRLPVFAGDAPRCHLKFDSGSLMMEPLMRTGAAITSYKVGRMLDHELKVIHQQDGNGAKSANEDVSSSPDYTSLVTVEGRIFSVTQFASETSTGTGSIGAVYMSELSQDVEGRLEVTR